MEFNPDKKFAVFEEVDGRKKRLSKCLTKLEAGVYLNNLNESQESSPDKKRYVVLEYLAE